MGLLPEIDRAWVTVDHRLLLWDWADGYVPRFSRLELSTEAERSSSFSTFEELPDVIVGVGLVTPRKGVFVDAISHLLVLATPNQITLVGIGYAPPSPGAKREVTFYLTGLTVPTDGISLTTVRGTSTGRIFLASSPDPLTPGGIGGDGCLYELVYQSAEGWFVKRCTLYNLTSGSLTQSIVPSFLRGLSAVATNEWIIALEVDNERGLVYTFLRNGTIEMYQLPSSAPGVKFDGPPTKVAKSGDVLRLAQVICPGSPMLNARNFKIVALEVLSVREGGNGKIGLVAVTSTGAFSLLSPQRARAETDDPSRRSTLLLPSAKRRLRLLRRHRPTRRSRTLPRPPSSHPFRTPTPSHKRLLRSTRPSSSRTRRLHRLQLDHPSQVRLGRAPPRCQQPHGGSGRPSPRCSRRSCCGSSERRSRCWDERGSCDEGLCRSRWDDRDRWKDVGHGGDYEEGRGGRRRDGVE